MSGLGAIARRAKNWGGLDASIRRHPLIYPRMRRWFDDLLLTEDAEARRQAVEERLARVLERAAQTPYGRSVGGRADLASWPLLDKSDVRRRPLGHFRHAAAKIRFPAATSGTGGLALRLERSWTSVAAEQAALDCMLFRWGGLSRPRRIAVLRGDVVKDTRDTAPPYWRETHGGRRLVLSSHHLTPKTAPAFYEKLAEARVDALFAYPTSVLRLADLLSRQGFSLSLPRVVTSSEVMTPAMRRRIEETFGAVSLDYYGQAERVALAFSPAPSCYRWVPGYAYVEFIPLDDPVGAEGTRRYEVVGTGLWNDAMLLVRYRTGDTVELPADLDPAAIDAVRWGAVPFAAVLGRRGQYVVTPEGAHIQSVDHIPYGVEHLVRLQIVQERLDRICLKILPARGFTRRDRERLLHNASRELPPTMRVDWEIADRLQTTPGGKTPLVIRRFGEEPERGPR